VRKDAVDELPRHLCRASRLVVERGNGGKDGGSGLSGQLHIAQMDPIERSLAHAKDKRMALFEADVGGAMDEVAGEAIGDGGERSHGAGKHDHGAGGIASAGDAGADVGVCVLPELIGRCSEQFFCKIVASAQLKFFREDTQGAFGRNEVNARDAIVRSESTQHLDGIDASTGSGYGERDSVSVGLGLLHRMIIA